jgi:hypothetical protein
MVESNVNFIAVGLPMQSPLGMERSATIDQRWGKDGESGMILATRSHGQERR